MSSLPDKTKGRYLDKKYEAKDWRSFSRYITDFNDSLGEDSDYKSIYERQVSAITNTETHKHNSYQRSKDTQYRGSTNNTNKYISKDN